MKKILIVDDIKPFVEQQKSILSRSDVHIFTATSGKEAFSIHKNVKVDLIISDLDMPGMNGDELCAAIRKETELQFVPIIMVTRPRKSDVERCRGCGANDYITKPINPDILIEKATAFLGVAIRKAYRVFVNVSIAGEQENAKFVATSVNISTAGMLIEVNKMLTIGDRVNCSFFLPGTPSISTSGEVVRAFKTPHGNAHQYGIRFTSLNDSSRQIIDGFVKSKASMP